MTVLKTESAHALAGKLASATILALAGKPASATRLVLADMSIRIPRHPIALGVT